ncbi:MAG: glycosyltransferase [Actinomycetota bacterium]
MSRPRHVNGRPALSGPGGFARYHHEVTARLVERDGATVVAPPARGAGPFARLVGARWWEQRSLVAATADGVLLSTANNGPIRHPCHAVIVHDLLPYTHPHTVSPTYARFQRAYLPRLCRSAAAVITVSDHVAGELVASFDLDPGTITVAPPGVGAPFRPDPNVDAVASRRTARARFGIGDHQVLVTALVSSIPRKRSAEVLHVLRTVAASRPEVAVVVAGHDGPRRVFGRHAVRPVAPDVPDLGPIADDALHELLVAADVFVALPEAEGFGLPQVEALVCGAAVVGAPVPSLTEWAMRPAGAGGVATATAVQLVADDDDAVDAVLDLVDRDHRGLVPTELPPDLDRLTWDRTAGLVSDVLHRLEDR